MIKVPEFTHNRREPRISIKALHNIHFISKKLNQELSLSNISTQGIGFIISPKNSWTKSEIIEGDLNIGNESFQVQAQIAHISKQVIGCKIRDVKPELNAAVANYFKVELSALSLNLVDEEFYSDSQEKKYLFEGKNNRGKY